MQFANTMRKTKDRLKCETFYRETELTPFVLWVNLTHNIFLCLKLAAQTQNKNASLMFVVTICTQLAANNYS